MCRCVTEQIDKRMAHRQKGKIKRNIKKNELMHFSSKVQQIEISTY